MVGSTSEVVASSGGVSSSLLAEILSVDTPIAAAAITEADDFIVDGIEGNGSVKTSLVNALPVLFSLERLCELVVVENEVRVHSLISAQDLSGVLSDGGDEQKHNEDGFGHDDEESFMC